MARRRAAIVDGKNERLTWRAGCRQLIPEPDAGALVRDFRRDMHFVAHSRFSDAIGSRALAGGLLADFALRMVVVSPVAVMVLAFAARGSRQLNTISGINLFIVILSCERKSARGLQPAGNVLGRQLVAGIPCVAHRPPHAIPRAKAAR